MSMNTALITSASDLDEFCAALAATPAIGLDTEFMRERTYRADLCLLQAATDADAAAAGPFVGAGVQNAKAAQASAATATSAPRTASTRMRAGRVTGPPSGRR